MLLKIFAMFIIVFILILNKVQCLNREILRANHPIYGLSSVVKETAVNSSVCFKELVEFRDAVDSEKVWGLKVLDASGKPPSGFLYGNNLWIGSHMQCIDSTNRKKFEIRNDKVNHTETPYDYPPYDLGFSMIMLRHNSTTQFQMRLPLDWVIQLGLCVPKSCSERELLQLSNEYFSNHPLEFQKEYQVNLTVSKVRVLKEDFWWMLKLPKTIIFIILISTILLLTIFGTIVDVKQHNKQKNLIRGYNYGITFNGKDSKDSGLNSVELVNSASKMSNNLKRSNIWIEILKCFSFYSNMKRWTKTKIGVDSLHVIHGLRFLAMGWVILVHTTFFEGDFVQNPPLAWRLTENFFSQIVSNSTYCVDTYLFLSGFLLAYLFFKNTNPHEVINKPVNYIRKSKQFIFLHINRYLRLTPTYAIIIFFCDIIYTFYSKKSSLYYSEQPHVLCDKYWWRNLLYINNLYPRSEMCLSWSWYLSADMQFFTITSFLLLLSTIWFSLSAFLVILLIFIQVTATAYKSYIIGYIPTLDDQLEQLDAIYDLPWNRIGPYLVGVITAYILEIKLKNKLVLKERTRLILWTIFPLLNLWILFTIYTRQISVEFSAFYMGVSRTLWGVGIAWIVVATSTGNARLLEKILSYQAWVPLGRLTYCAYLLNPLMVTMIGLGAEAAITISIPEMALSSAGTVFLTFLLSLLFSMLFESPFILLTKLAFKNITEKPKEKVVKKVDENGSKSDGGSTTSSDTSINTIV